MLSAAQAFLFLTRFCFSSQMPTNKLRKKGGFAMMSKLSTAWRLLTTNRWGMLLVFLEKLRLANRIPDKQYLKINGAL